MSCISLKKTNVLVQDSMKLPAITMDDCESSMSLNGSHVVAPTSVTTDNLCEGVEGWGRGRGAGKAKERERERGGGAGGVRVEKSTGRAWVE